MMAECLSAAVVTIYFGRAKTWCSCIAMKSPRGEGGTPLVTLSGDGIMEALVFR